MRRELASLTDEQAAYLLRDWRFWARPDQLEPPGNWDTWLVLAGRGWGKTRVGAEWVKQQQQAGAKRIAIIAETYKDLVEVMMEGDSGLLSLYPPDEMPDYRRNPVRLEWKNGTIALGYNATQPDQLRGPQFDAAWCDELAKWKHARETWDMLQFGLRLGGHPRACITTTPRPIALIREMVSDPRVHVTRGRTYDNAANLADTFIAAIERRFAGTRRGRQEIDAEILDDMPGAIWRREWIDAARRKEPPALRRKVVAVDPAVSSDRSSDDPGTHGIVAAALGEDGRGYVLADVSMQGTPREWAARVVSLYDEIGADQVVIEINQGGDMVESTLRSVRPTLPIRRVRATRGKHVRAEPVASLYEQGRISHVGMFSALEDQMCEFTSDGYQGDGSPDRADALVWCLSDLFGRIIHHKEQPKDKAPPSGRRYFGARNDDDQNYKVL